MGRYYFDLLDGDVLNVDNEGTDSVMRTLPRRRPLWLWRNMLATRYRAGLLEMLS
jgi:hypothetical protein